MLTSYDHRAGQKVPLAALEQALNLTVLCDAGRRAGRITASR